MIRYYTGHLKEFKETEDFSQASWINLFPPFLQGELENLSSRLDISIDFLTDPLDIEERVRYEKYDEARSIIFHIPVMNDVEKENDPIYITIPLGIILCQNKIITVCAVENFVLEKFIENKVRNFDPSNERNFILQIFENTVFLYLEFLKKLNMRRRLIEQELYNSSRSEELKSLLRIEKSLVYFVNSLTANELLKIKLRRADFLGIKDDEDLTELFEDIIVDNNQAREVAQLYTNILNGTMEAYASIISNNLNIFINRLTIITILLMVPTVVASFLGMNMPLPFGIGESNLSFYLIVLITMGLSLCVAWFFKSKNIF
ncbi:MAG: magnesium transporter CorA family protein [Bacteroidota bacterium]|nr:magnesium transporter CorA family protein [Bacteroidota bacterium]